MAHQRIGVFGGTFDPPHIGHLLAATDACEQLALDRVVFIPTAAQPLKREHEAAADHRVAMVKLLVDADPRFEVDALEVERGGLSYTVDTLRQLRQRWPAGTAGLFVLLGADAAAQFPQWRDPAGVLSLAEVVVLTRADVTVALPDGLKGIATRRVDVSSTEIRDRVRAGKSVRGLLTDEVAAYIVRTGLYR